MMIVTLMRYRGGGGKESARVTASKEGEETDAAIYSVNGFRLFLRYRLAATDPTKNRKQGGGRLNCCWFREPCRRSRGQLRGRRRRRRRLSPLARPRS